MSKLLKEDCKSISIFNLRKWGVFKRVYYRGSIYWTIGENEKRGNVGYELDLEKRNFKLSYKIRDRNDGEEWRNIEYSIPLLSTPCKYGNVRWWFQCPMHKSGRYCGRRVAKLYLAGGSEYFACRHCYDLAYQSQMEGGKIRLGKVYESDVEKAYDEIKRMYYKGKPTRRYRRYLRLRDKMDDSWIKAAAKFGKRAGI